MALLPHVVTKTLADGTVTKYAYAFRGGPRVSVLPGHPEFEAKRAEVMDAWRRSAGAEIAARRIKGDEDRAIHEIALKLAKNARQRAARRRLTCTITAETICALLKLQGRKCAVSGLPFNLVFNLAKTHSRNLFAPSLDRIDNIRGYEPGNVRIVLAAVNYAINEWGLDHYLNICRAVAANNPEKT